MSDPATSNGRRPGGDAPRIDPPNYRIEDVFDADGKRVGFEQHYIAHQHEPIFAKRPPAQTVEEWITGAAPGTGYGGSRRPESPATPQGLRDLAFSGRPVPSDRLADLANDPRMGMENEVIVDLASRHTEVLLDDWADRHPDITTTVRPSGNVDLSYGDEDNIFVDLATKRAVMAERATAEQFAIDRQVEIDLATEEAVLRFLLSDDDDAEMINLSGSSYEWDAIELSNGNHLQCPAGCACKAILQ
jgi:hypothetical protein